MSFVGKMLGAPFRLLWFLVRITLLPLKLVFKVLGWLLCVVSHNLAGGIIGGVLGYLIGRKLAEPQRTQPNQPPEKPPETAFEQPRQS